jgi:hypothetical protein
VNKPILWETDAIGAWSGLCFVEVFRHECQWRWRVRFVGKKRKTESSDAKTLAAAKRAARQSVLRMERKRTIRVKWRVVAVSVGAWIGRHIGCLHHNGLEWSWYVRFNLDERPVECGFEKTLAAAKRAAERTAKSLP